MTSVNKQMAATSGDALSDRDIQDLALEAEEGYDLSRMRRRRLGRPSLAGSGPSPRVSFRASRALYEATRERAAREGSSVSEVARRAVERYVAG